MWGWGRFSTDPRQTEPRKCAHHRGDVAEQAVLAVANPHFGLGGLEMDVADLPGNGTGQQLVDQMDHAVGGGTVGIGHATSSEYGGEGA